MRTKILLLITCLISFSTYQLNAQSKQISGKVIDAKSNQPIGGITINIVGTNFSTSTNKDGQFLFNNFVENAELLISGVGYESIKIKYAPNFVARLYQSSESLSEVVVVGYGSSKKKDLTGSVTAISSKDFVKGVFATPEQLISGKIAGVQISTNSGQPGSGSTIRIRGGSSLSASNDPLIVIDGLILSNDKIAGQSNPLSLINPEDIETFTVLKDASATAIYGSRGSNGVILITSKKGKLGELKFNLNTQASLQTIANKVKVLTGDEIRNIVQNNQPALLPLLGTSNTDWQDQIYQNALSLQNNLSVSGSLAKIIPFRLSISNLNQDGILKTDNLNRNTINLNLSPILLDNHLKLDVNVIYSLSKSRFADQGAIGAAANFDPTQSIYSKSPRFGGYWEWLDPNSTNGLKALSPKNPLGLLNQKQDNSDVNRLIANASIDYKFHFLPDLRAVVNVGIDKATSTGTIVINDSAASSYKNYKVNDSLIVGGQNNQYKQERNNTYLNAYLNYSKEVKSIRTIFDLTAGYEFQNYLLTIYNFPDISYNNTIKTTPNFLTDKPENSIESFMGRLSINVLNKYVLTGTIRQDASTKFNVNNRKAIFPSFAFAWKINEEGFLKNSNNISNLKLRIGYGITGQQDGINNFDYLSFYSLTTSTAYYQFGNQFVQGNRPGGYYFNRKWEQTTTKNIALDFGFINNRISGTIEVYNRTTTDLLNDIGQPALTNFTNRIVANVGSMENEGVEFTLNLNPINTKDWNWDIAFNAAYNKNTITKLTLSNDPNYVGLRYEGISGGVGNNILIQSVNYNRGSFFVFKQIYDATGNPIDGLYSDLNRDGIINEKDLYQYKGIDPKWIFGFSSNLSYKKWSAGIVMRANLDNYVYNNVSSSTGTLRNLINPIGYINNGSNTYLQTGFSGSGSNYYFSDYYVENASFLRIDNINVSYNIGKIIQNKVNLSINANVQNVLVITKYKGLDPEINKGVDNNFYPRPRTFVLGLNFKF